jgi:hypothetical protein
MASCSHMAYSPRSAITTIRHSGGMFPRSSGNNCSQYGFQEPDSPASTMCQATGIMHPRTITLMLSAVKRFPSDPSDAQTSRSPKHASTTTSRLFLPYLAEASSHHSRNLCRTRPIGQCHCLANQCLTRVILQPLVSTIPELHWPSTLPCAGLRWGRCRCTSSCH